MFKKKIKNSSEFCKKPKKKSFMERLDSKRTIQNFYIPKSDDESDGFNRSNKRMVESLNVYDDSFSYSNEY